MTKNLETKTAILHSRVGMALTTFALIEWHLGLLFAGCLGLPIDVAVRMLAPVRNFSTTLEIIDAAVRYKIGKSMPYWLSLLEYVRELSGDRNYLAHTPMINYMPDSGSHPRDVNLAEPRLGPAISAFLSENIRRQPLSAEEILEINRDFEQAVQLLADLQSGFASSSLDKFAQPIVRRRPSRGKRQAASPPKQAAGVKI
jgi:hypothetical protein